MNKGPRNSQPLCVFLDQSESVVTLESPLTQTGNRTVRYFSDTGKGLTVIMENQKGFVDHIIYRNGDNGYTVLVLSCESEDITCVGTFKDVDQGEMLEVHGDFVEHPVYGEQLKVAEYRILAPEDAVSMERYLGSGAIKGIGPALAARIVKKFGNDTFRIIEEEPERLAEIKGISENKAREIAVFVEEKKDLRLQFCGSSNQRLIDLKKTKAAGKIIQWEGE